MEPRFRALLAPATFSLLALVILSPGTRAQDRSVVFVHGYPSQPSTWSSFQNQLESGFEINSTKPQWFFNQGFSQTASTYRNSIPQNSVIIAHSAGGVLAREIVRTYGTQRMSDLITIGTPHRGAPVAFGETAAPVLFNWTRDLTDPWLLAFVDPAVVNIWVDEALDGIFTVVDLQIEDATSGSVPLDLRPDSPFMGQLNASPATTVPAATYAIYGDEDWQTHLRLGDSFVNNRVEDGAWVRDWIDIRNLYYFHSGLFVFSAFDWYLQYLDTGNPSDLAEAERRFLVAGSFYHGGTEIDEGWQRDWSYGVVGNGYWGATSELAGHDDGFIPNGSQAPPFLDGRHLRAEGTNHNEETKNEESLGRIEFALAQPDIDVPRTTSPPPPSPPTPPPGDECEELRQPHTYDPSLTPGPCVPQN